MRNTEKEINRKAANMFNIIKVKTTSKVEAKDITDEVLKAVRGKDGRILNVYTPHTTCGLVINEDADPNVMRDIIEGLERLAPRNHPYRHMEGNSDAHIKSTLTGCSLMIPFSEGKPMLGQWQGIFLMEFDGPRERKVFLTLIQ
ncbi:MAG TPA: secondary thiamine-phosphate synthase enzyme YjbQ [Syntrophorhabdaceae bacterium]|nr:secondary thiamine-phosphate synthase enzyme YjbQ [Syntrophorhabdaceae bacterium]HOT42496.1 secondary thiamine-phosphate synthase enzyme YjbQ [Syntrophorhabdaceae bacterium]HPC65936.1 secondary thiamine-phosphate synthase enzyme YjbQ [Syntrophorhabdaceae bacterium]HQE80870.1 secondary thiamine-phosphate synthase enzyme YjbQ [Syntrophorhabdaceae bacterium]HQH44018.1 secondary thiamine-phosphate synthase enzyme YjbQ [Syntrophorhabdaceae bacterium]